MVRTVRSMELAIEATAAIRNTHKTITKPIGKTFEGFRVRYVSGLSGCRISLPLLHYAVFHDHEIDTTPDTHQGFD